MPQALTRAVKPVVPESFRSELRTMRANRDPRLAMTLYVATLNEWTLQSLGDALGVSRQCVEQKLRNVDTSRIAGDLPDVPVAPRRSLPPPKPPRPTLRIKPEVIAELRRMQEVAATVRGGTPADAPSRVVSVEFTALLDSLVRQGVTVYALAKALGIQRSGIDARLARHGYRKPVPSQEGHSYGGRPATHGEKEFCRFGHPLFGDNLYVAPRTGFRTCRACDRRRGREYKARKRAKGTACEAVSMPVTPVPRYCLCDHAETGHRSDGACRERDDAGQPCGCREFEPDEGA